MTPKKSPEVKRDFKLDSTASRIQFLPHKKFISLQKYWPSPRAKITPTVIPTKQTTEDDSEWGKAKQVSEHTWTMKIALDDKMATAQEIFEALNNYRRQHSREALTWDDRLASFAKQRAAYFTSIGKTDEHAGFISYTNSIDSVKGLGFWSLGENSSFGYRMEGVHLIEWVYAADEGHNNNQLDSNWNHIGVGVDGNQTDLIFGGNKM